MADSDRTDTVLSIEESNKVLESFIASVQTRNGPVPSSYKSLRLEEHLSDLKTESDAGSTTATYLVFEYYYLTDTDCESYMYWKNKAAAMGIEKAVRAPGTDCSQSINGWSIVALLGLALVTLMLFARRRSRKAATQ